MIYWLTIYGFSFFATEAVAMACEASWSQKTRLPVGGAENAGQDIAGQDNDGQTGRV